MECEGANGEDLSGGYFEAGGSYLKFSYPLAFTITNLAWGVVEYRDGYAKVRSCSPLHKVGHRVAASLVSQGASETGNRDAALHVHPLCAHAAKLRLSKVSGAFYWH